MWHDWIGALAFLVILIFLLISAGFKNWSVSDWVILGSSVIGGAAVLIGAFTGYGR